MKLHNNSICLFYIILFNSMFTWGYLDLCDFSTYDNYLELNPVVSRDLLYNKIDTLICLHLC